MDRLKGYRTYLSAAAVVVLAVLQGWLGMEIPEWVYGALFAGGLAFERAAVGTVAKAVGDVKATVENRPGGAQ